MLQNINDKQKEEQLLFIICAWTQIFHTIVKWNHWCTKYKSALSICVRHILLLHSVTSIIVLFITDSLEYRSRGVFLHLVNNLLYEWWFSLQETGFMDYYWQRICNMYSAVKQKKMRLCEYLNSLVHRKQLVVNNLPPKHNSVWKKHDNHEYNQNMVSDFTSG